MAKANGNSPDKEMAKDNAKKEARRQEAKKKKKLNSEGAVIVREVETPKGNTRIDFE